MNFLIDNLNVVNYFCNQYFRYLLLYEMKFSKSNFIDDIKINFLEGLGILFFNVIVICLEVIILINSLMQILRVFDFMLIYGIYSLMINDFVFNLFLSYSGKDGYFEFSYDINKMYLEFRENFGSFLMNFFMFFSLFGMF